MPTIALLEGLPDAILLLDRGGAIAYANAAAERLFGQPASELAGLVYGTKSPGVEEPPAEGDAAWYRRPALLGWGAIALAALCYVPYSF